MHNHVQSRRLFYIYTLLCTTSLCPTSVQLYRRCERALSLSCSIAVLALLSLIRAYNHYASTLEQKVFGERHRSTSRGVSRRPFAILNLSSSLVPAHREPSSFNSRVRGILIHLMHLFFAQTHSRSVARGLPCNPFCALKRT